MNFNADKILNKKFGYILWGVFIIIIGQIIVSCSINDLYKSNNNFIAEKICSKKIVNIDTIASLVAGHYLEIKTSNNKTYPYFFDYGREKDKEISINSILSKEANQNNFKISKGYNEYTFEIYDLTLNEIFFRILTLVGTVTVAVIGFFRIILKESLDSKQQLTHAKSHCRELNENVAAMERNFI